MSPGPARPHPYHRQSSKRTSVGTRAHAHTHAHTAGIETEITRCRRRGWNRASLCRHHTLYPRHRRHRRRWNPTGNTTGIRPNADHSVARRDLNADTAAGLQMLRWAVRFVLGRNDESWSLENVPTKATRTLMAELVAAHPARVAFAVFDSADYGAPQSRLRLIAGPPALIRMLQGIPCARRVSVRHAFESAGKEVPAPCYKNQTRSQYGRPTTRSVETQSFTVCAGHALTWCEADGKTARVMTAWESAILMGFPSTWALPHGSRAAPCHGPTSSLLEIRTQTVAPTGARLLRPSPPSPSRCRRGVVALRAP